MSNAANNWPWPRSLHQSLTRQWRIGDREISEPVASQQSRPPLSPGPSNFLRTQPPKSNIGHRSDASQNPPRNCPAFSQWMLESDEAFFRCVIRDEGPGFNPEMLPDPFSSESLERPSGRGLTLIRAFADEVTFNDQGNEITLMMRRPLVVSAMLQKPGGPGNIRCSRGGSVGEGAMP